MSTDPDVRPAAPSPLTWSPPVTGLHVSWLTSRPAPGWFPVWRALADSCHLSLWTPHGLAEAGPGRGAIQLADGGPSPGPGRPLRAPWRTADVVSADVVMLAGGTLRAAGRVVRAARRRRVATVALVPPRPERIGGGRLLRSVDAVLVAGPAPVRAVLALGVEPGRVVETQDPTSDDPDPARGRQVAADALDALRLAWLTRQFWVKGSDTD